MNIFLAFLAFGTALVLSWFRFRTAIGVLILALPTYLIRFKIGPFPTTLLELLFGAIFLVWLIRFAREDVVKIWGVMKINLWFFIFMGLFFVGSLIGVGVSDMVILSLGQWRAYFLEPMLLFFVVIGRLSPVSLRGAERRSNPPVSVSVSVTNEIASLRPSSARNDSNTVSVSQLISYLIFSSLSVVFYSLFQKITGLGIATPEWTLSTTRRVTAFFSSPNAVGLYLEPLILLTVGYYFSFRSSIPDPRQALLPTNDRRRRILLVALPVLIGLQLLAVVCTKSDGTVLALGAALVVSLFLAGYKKIVATLVALAIVATVLVPKIHSVVLFRDQSGQNRLTLWSYSLEFLTASPKNFVAGAGVRQFFRKIQKPHYNVKEMERLIYPHNIVFNFWTETGLLGLLGFGGMMGCLGVYAYHLLRRERSSGMLVVALLTVTLVHGMVDVPYFKNDLAMLWWIVAALIMCLDCSPRLKLSRQVYGPS